MVLNRCLPVEVSAAIKDSATLVVRLDQFLGCVL